MNKTIIHINSAQRLTGTSSDFTFDISEQTAAGINYDYITLLSFNMPKSYYLINQYNRTFTIREIDAGLVSSDTQLTITQANYTVTSLIKELNRVMTTSVNPSLQNNYVASFDSSSGKITFTCQTSLPSNRQSAFIFPSTYRLAGLFRQLGFDSAFVTPINTFSSNSLTGPNVINLQLAGSVKLYCDLIGEEGSLLSSIISDNPDFSSITWHNNTPEFTSRRLTTNTKTPRFYLLNGDTLLPLDLNGLNLNFVIVMYKNVAHDYYKTMLKDYHINNAIKDLSTGV